VRPEVLSEGWLSIGESRCWSLLRLDWEIERLDGRGKMCSIIKACYQDNLTKTPFPFHKIQTIQTVLLIFLIIEKNGSAY